DGAPGGPEPDGPGPAHVRLHGVLRSAELFTALGLLFLQEALRCREIAPAGVLGLADVLLCVDVGEQGRVARRVARRGNHEGVVDRAAGWRELDTAPGPCADAAGLALLTQALVYALRDRIRVLQYEELRRDGAVRADERRT